MYRVIWSPFAKSELQEIRRQIFVFAPQSANLLPLRSSWSQGEP